MGLGGGGGAVVCSQVSLAPKAEGLRTFAARSHVIIKVILTVGVEFVSFRANIISHKANLLTNISNPSDIKR